MAVPKGKHFELAIRNPFLPCHVSIAIWLLLALQCAPRLDAQGAAEMPMPADGGSTQAAASDWPQTMIPPESTLSPSSTLQGGFFSRFYNTYGQELNENESEEPEEPWRIPSSPLSSPPFPPVDWSYGGSSVIGESNTTNYPLMRAIYAGPSGDAWKASGVQIYGWIDPGFNLSTSSHSNLPAGYDIVPNRLELDQFVTYIERVPDTAQTSHFDWGFRFANFFGIDYHFTTAEGWLSQQLLQDHRLYGDNPVNLYGDLYFPKVAQGLISASGAISRCRTLKRSWPAEKYVQPSLLYSYDPFTQRGVITTWKFNDRWLMNLGISARNDIAPWAKGANPHLRPASAIRLITERTMSITASGTNSGKYAYNNVQFYVNNWHHKFNERWHMATEEYYEYEETCPASSAFGQPCLMPMGRTARRGSRNVTPGCGRR